MGWTIGDVYKKSRDSMSNSVQAVLISLLVAVHAAGLATSGAAVAAACPCSCSQLCTISSTRR